MKLAIICPIGNLNRFGYWRIAEPCLTSWLSLGDLFLIHSSRTNLPFKIAATIIRDSRTLMQIEDGHGERFDYHLVADNANLGIEAARQAGYDCALTICVNWYIEDKAGHAVIEKYQRMIREGRFFDFLFRRIQVGEYLFDSDRKSIVMFNLGKVKDNVVKVLVDCAQFGSMPVTASRGDFSAWNGEAYIDCEFELTLDEMKEKLADVRNYEDILAKRHGADWSFWEQYYAQRAGQMRMSDDALGTIGRHIATLHQKDSLGNWVLNQMAAQA